MNVLQMKTQEGMKAREQVMDEIMGRVSELLCSLHARWAEEREYENFDDYAEAISKRLPPDVFIKATKRPFGAIVRPKDFPFDVQISVTSRTIGWSAIQKKTVKRVKLSDETIAESKAAADKMNASLKGTKYQDIFVEAPRHINVEIDDSEVA